MQAGCVRSLRREPCHAHIRSPTLRNGGRRRQRWCSRIEPLGSTVARSLPGTLDLSNNPIFRSIVLLFVFGVFIPVTLAAIYVTSAVNVVLDALGLPLLPNVPDPPFGPATPLATANTTPTAESNPVASTEDQHPVGDSGLKLRKPKADKADGEQTHDQSSKQGPK
jgi:hypothetical protein